MSDPETTVSIGSRAEWREWLAENHALQAGVWLVYFKKASKRQSISYDEAVEEAICFGWVDSKPRKLDDMQAMLYFSPRKKGSGWSKANKDRVAKLTKAGLMMPAGLAKVEAAKKDGSWSKLDAVEALVIPEDLKLAMQAFPKAAGNFEAFPRSVKRSILEWITNAKKAETRTKRIEETARLAAENKRANQWRG